MKNDDRQESDGDARNDQVDRVEQSLPSYGDVECDVRIRFRTARVILLVLAGRHAQQIPFDALVEVFEIDSVLDRVVVVESGRIRSGMSQIDLNTTKQAVAVSSFLSLLASKETVDR